jgi:hypothetical protein
MAPFRTFISTVSSVVTALDVIETCHWPVLIDSMKAASVTGVGAVDILQKMHRSGLLVSDGSLISITHKGRALAADIRAITSKVVKP